MNPPTRSLLALASVMLGTLQGGCAAEDAGRPPARLDASQSSAGAGSVRQPDPGGLTVSRASEEAVVIDGSTIPWRALHGPLAEVAGAMVLEETALDRALEREAARRGITVGEEAVAAEERALLDELEGAPENRIEVLNEVRRSRGLGPIRYERLLRRNALLRAMVRDQAALSDEEVELAMRLSYGPTMRVRLFVSHAESAAAAVRQAASDAPAEGRSWVFAERAADASAHPSAARGGLVERFHPDDPAYPSLLGRAAADLEPGGVSRVLATPSGFAVLLLEARTPGREVTPEDRRRVEQRLRQRKERLAMERLARELIARTTVSPVDPDLARAWRQRR